MVPRPPMLQRRFLSTATATNHRRRCPVKQVTKANFSEALDQIKNHLGDSDFVAVSLQKTGSFSSPWHRVLPIDTADTAYFKAKYAAERFQVLQFAVCPFSIRASKVIAHPYNFHLFPRDELKIGMPSYSFSCQSSYLTSMAREGFDFNACIYNGISYLSRAQESASKDRIGNPVPSKYVIQSSSALSVADAVFVERIKSRVRHWRNAFKDTSTRAEEALIKSLRKLILGSEEYGSRPCLSIDVCSERQVQLALEMLRDFSDDLVPLLIPTKGGETQAVRVVLTSSKEDKETFERELQNLEDEQNKRVRGFREVLCAFGFPPHTRCQPSDEGNWPYEKDDASESKIHGHDVLRISELFAKLCSILKIAPVTHEDENGHLPSVLDDYTNIFNPCSTSSQDHTIDEDVSVWTDNRRKVDSKDLVFLWGFRGGMSARTLKKLLHDSHDVFSEEFDVRLLDKSCAVVAFWNPGLSESFLEAMDSGGISCESLREMISEGLRAATYQTYRRACRLGVLEADLADSLEKALGDADSLSEAHSEESSEIYWDSDLMINLNDL